MSYALRPANIMWSLVRSTATKYGSTAWTHSQFVSTVGDVPIAISQ